VTFAWKDTGARDLGLVAEEVEAVAPILATRNAAGQVEGVKYDRLSTVLVKALQEQQSQITGLEARNAQLEARLAALEARSGAAPAVRQPPAAIFGAHAAPHENGAGPGLAARRPW
jgi:hypothetical protein